MNEHVTKKGKKESRNCHRHNLAYTFLHLHLRPDWEKIAEDYFPVTNRQESIHYLLKINRRGK